MNTTDRNNTAFAYSVGLLKMLLEMQLITKEEYKNGNLTAFLAAYKYGYIDDLYWLVKQKQHKKGYWTYKNIEKEALKYNTKTEFFRILYDLIAVSLQFIKALIFIKTDLLHR